jgi:hypothetical protein
MSTTPISTSVNQSLNNLQNIERELSISLIERDEVIRAAIVALLTHTIQSFA